MIAPVNKVKTGGRRERTRTTRLKIIRAAHAEFLEHGYHGATMAEIARRAAVAPQTVYFVFHTKAELIRATIDTAVLSEDDPTDPEQGEWWVAMDAAATGVETLEHFVRGAGHLYARAAGISEVLRAAALTDPDVHAIWRQHDQQHVAALRRVIETVATKSPLRSGLDLAAATDILITIYGDSAYLLLTTERGWSHDRVIDWVCQALPVLLLEPGEER
jgi:AcrR family transcriptional regulator